MSWRPTRWSPAGLGRLMGVRARSVLVAVIVVLVALVLGGSGLVAALQSNLEQAAEATARARVAEIVSRIATSGLSPTAAGLGDQRRSDTVSQIISADGTVIASSRPTGAGTALSSQRPAVGDYTSVERDLDQLDEGGEWKVITTAVSSSGVTYYVLAAVPIGIQRDAVQTVTVLLLIGAPLLLLAVALAVWVLVGRALRSVEGIRTTVAEIDARALESRLEVPPTRDEIAALAVTMNAMLDRLQTSDRAQRRFVSDASHELRSPLATLSTAAELALRSHDGHVRTGLLETMNAELSRMRCLVDNLMALARVDAHEPGAPAVEIDLDDLVSNEAIRLRATSARRVEMVIEPARIRGDLPRVAQPLRNLVDNAERHAATTIRLTVAATDDLALILVENDGPAIARHDRDRIFDRFVRLDDSRSRDMGGSGLGLAITRAGLQSQGGDVRVADAPDGWCRFQVTLPLARS